MEAKSEERENDITHLQELIKKHRRNISLYEEMRADYGTNVPIEILTGLEREREQLEEAMQALEQLQRETGAAHIPTPPCNLPQRTEFIGRKREKEEVRKALASRAYLVVIEGIGGIGKTALALEVAHELWQERAFGAAIWASSRDREITLGDILDTIGRTLDYPYIPQLPPEQKPAEVAKLLRAQACLLLLDNFETIKDEAVLRFLAELPEPSKALITSRHQVSLGARVITLRGMEQDEALELIRNEGRRLGLAAVAEADERPLLRLYQATAGAPLALKWAVGQIKQRGQSLEGVLEALRTARGDLFEEMFNRAWGLLTEPSRRVLMVMPIFASSASKAAMEAAGDVHGWDLDDAMAQLVEMSLLEVSDDLEEETRRYSVHPLTRAFATAQLQKDAEAEKAAWLRAADYFLGFAKEYGGWYWSGDRLESELKNLFAVMDWCYQSDEWKRFIDFMPLMEFFLERRGYWIEHLRYGEKAIAAAEKMGDKKAITRQKIFALGWTHMFWRRDYERADLLLREGQKLAEECGDQELLAQALSDRGTLASRLRKYDEAIDLLMQSLEMWQRLGNKRWLAITMGRLGDVEFSRRNLDRAWQNGKEALRISEEIGDKNLQADNLRRLGHIAIESGKIDEAEQFYMRSWELKGQISDIVGIADNQLGLARIAKRRGNYSQALSLAQDALKTYEKTNAPNLERTRELIARLERKLAGQGNENQRGVE